MKLLLSILSFAITITVNAQTKKIEWVNIGTLYDSALTLKPGSHKVIVKKTIGTKVSYDTLQMAIMPDTNSFRVNYMPTADAGNDTTWTYGKTATVRGSGYDPDGKIVSYKWSRRGPLYGKVSYSTRSTTTLTNLGKGIHILTLVVTDDNGGQGRDEVIIKVE